MLRRAKKLLLVDDEPMILRVLRRFLEKHKYLVYEALDAQTALGLFHKEQPFHALLCDVHLGMDNGWKLAEEIYLSQPSIRVLMLSGSTEFMTIPDTLSYIMLHKPFNQNNLITVLEGHWP